MTTLREQAAIAAMQGLLASDSDMEHSHESIAKMARAQADILLAELERTTPATAADATRLTCTVAERELIEASLAPSLSRILAALDAIRAERAKEASK